MKKIKLVLFAIFGLCISMVNARIFKDTIWVPVTFYDFHSDGSNPEFEPPFYNMQEMHTGMVANTLDADGKPQVGTSINQNAYVKYWFRPWANDSLLLHAKGDYTIPVYTQTGGTAFDAQIRYDGPRTVTYDTAFKNIVIHDSLPFHHIGSGLYQYENQAFFPLDGKGLGNEKYSANGTLHNFSFAMELKWPFQKKTGQTFDFNGDDDVWAFVNKNLVMDLGGLHPAANGSFTINSNIPENAVCTLSVFYCERHTTESDIKITTNIISPKLTLHIAPIICLGDTVVAIAQISSGTQVLTKLPSGCTMIWGLIDPNNPASTISKIDSVAYRFVPIKASTAKIWCDLYDPVDNFHLRDTATVVTNLCFPEPFTMDLYDAPGNPKTMSSLPDTITVVAGTHKNVYAKLFDSLQHTWIGQYENSSLSYFFQWTLSDTTFADSAKILSNGSNVDFYSTRAYKHPKLTATYSGNKVIHHSVFINVIPDTAENLVIEPNPNGFGISPNKSQHFLDNTIIIQPNETTVKAYAVLRDKWGNFICPSNLTNWSIDKPISSVTNGIMNFGEVIITRIDSGLTVVYSKDTKTGLQGSVNLKVLNYYYKELKVTVKQKGTGKDTLLPVDSLILPFNQDTVLWAIGKRSDNGNWESTTANWEISKSLAGTVNPVSNSYAMIISPRDTGTGWIRITNGNDAVTIPDTIIIKFTQKATKASIEILHEPSHFTYKLNGSTLFLSSPRKYVGSAVVVSDISGRTVDRFTLDGPKMQRVLGSKKIGDGSGLYIMIVTGRQGRIVVPIKMGN